MRAFLFERITMMRVEWLIAAVGSYWLTRAVLWGVRRLWPADESWRRCDGCAGDECPDGCTADQARDEHSDECEGLQ